MLKLFFYLFIFKLFGSFVLSGGGDVPNIVANLSVLFSTIFFGASVVVTRMVVQDISPLLLALLRDG